MRPGKIRITPELYAEKEFMEFLKTKLVIKSEEKSTSLGYPIWILYCESELFEEIKEGEVIPYYDITMHRSPDSTLVIEKVEKYYA